MSEWSIQWTEQPKMRLEEEADGHLRLVMSGGRFSPRSLGVALLDGDPFAVDEIKGWALEEANRRLAHSIDQGGE